MSSSKLSFLFLLEFKVPESGGRVVEVSDSKLVEAHCFITNASHLPSNIFVFSNNLINVGMWQNNANNILCSFYLQRCFY